MSDLIHLILILTNVVHFTWNTGKACFGKIRLKIFLPQNFFLRMSTMCRLIESSTSLVGSNVVTQHTLTNYLTHQAVTGI